MLEWFGAEGRAVARCGVPAGCESRAFSLRELAGALVEAPNTVYVERDSMGRLSGCGGVLAGDCASVAARARLAPHPPARSAALRGSGGAGAGALRVACVRALAPHEELLLWPDDQLLARAGVPVLAPRHIRGGADYRCDSCGARFLEPNPLKVHMYLSCAPPAAPAFWRRFLRRLAAALTPPPPPPTPSPTPATIEALAAAWGAYTARGAGHVCLYCGKLYSRKYGLKIHIRTHTGYKPLRCEHCARRFGDPSNLNKHVRLHAGARGALRGEARGGAGRHACARCGAVLARRRDLERHVRARHAAPDPPALRAG